MAQLTETECDCLDRYCALLFERLGDRPLDVRMFGSAASGDMWRAGSPMHSDVDLLVVTSEFLDRIAGDVRIVWPPA
jgi:predicted nucleotidyltransferase